MISINAKGVLLDIEGTTSSIRFVHDEMFPYARRKLESYLESNWNADSLNDCIELLAKDLSHESAEKWLTDESDDSGRLTTIVAAVNQMMDGDVKATGLKQLQGLIWKEGFHNGELVAHLYPDSAPAIRAWVEAGLDVRIYSSGSVGAQKLFFGHTVDGDLLSLFGGHYDTKTGPKKEADSYILIAKEFDLEPDQIVFLSDVSGELDAAKTAGLQTILSLREGNAVVANLDQYQSINSFAELEISTT